jgi:uncharacterized protein (TIGR02996 family)
VTDEAVFLKALAARPDDSTTRLVYADWLDEAGRSDEAFAHRWMARMGLGPGLRTYTGETYRSAAQVPARRPAGPFRWGWWPEMEPGSRTTIHCPAHAVLPRPVFFALSKVGFYTLHRYYPSEKEAVADLVRALAELRQALGLNG